ncbi:hypothetical protein TNCV_3359691 [Trichonephila clavipes]|nr:hypothetical protein TNCV_3359691 [Trichonephila clavipes]
MFRKTQSTIPSLKHAHGIATSGDQKANVILLTVLKQTTQKTKDQTISQTTSTLTSLLRSRTSSLTYPPAPIAPTDPDEIINYINNLKTNKAPGYYDSPANQSESSVLPIHRPHYDLRQHTLFRDGTEERCAFYVPKNIIQLSRRRTHTRKGLAGDSSPKC